MFRLQRIAKAIGVSSVFGLSNLFCYSKQTEFPFVEVVQYNANNPIEDRFSYAKLTSIDGFTASVFDGHGGDLCAQYVSKNLNQCIDDRIRNNKNAGLSNEGLIEKSLKEAYSDVQNGFFAIFKANLDKKPYRTVGACGLTAVVLKNSLHIANAGDCEGVLLSKNEAAMTNLRLNAGESFEQARLIKEFPAEPDIFVCKSACYVKGRLQPTRSFGDFYLKSKEYNFTRIKVFTGPYITSEPLVTHFKLTDEHKNLLLASDGLWDEMDARVIHRTFNEERQKLGRKVFDKAIQIILEREKIKSIEQLSKIAYRRDLHDDITIVNLRLDDLRSQL